MNSKKGSVIDVLGILLAFLVVVVIFVVMSIAYTSTADGLEQAASSITVASYNESIETVVSDAEKFPVFWDFLIAFILFGFWLASFISGFVLGNNPIFIVLFIIVAIPMFFLGIVFETVLQEFVEVSVIAPYANEFPITLFLVDHLFLFTIFFIVTILGALYVKNVRGSD